MWETLVRKNRVSALVSITFNHKKKGEGESFFSMNKKFHGGMRRRDPHYNLIGIFKYDFLLMWLNFWTNMDPKQTPPPPIIY